MSNKRLKLYWCSTGDHDEDWFMVARNSRQAASLHANWEGYDPGDAQAEFVAEIPDEWQGICMHCRKPWTEETLKYIPGTQGLAEASCPHCDGRVIGWPVDKLLEACGGKIVKEGSDKDKTVILAGRKFAMGAMEVRANRTRDDLVERQGGGRPHGTTPSRQMN